MSGDPLREARDLAAGHAARAAYCEGQISEIIEWCRTKLGLDLREEPQGRTISEIITHALGEHILHRELRAEQIGKDGAYEAMGVRVLAAADAPIDPDENKSLRSLRVLRVVRELREENVALKAHITQGVEINAGEWPEPLMKLLKELQVRDLAVGPKVDQREEPKADDER